MKSAIQIVITAIVCFMFQKLFPWWTMAIGAFLVGFIFSNTVFRSFLAGFVAIGLLWLGLALYVDNATQSILTEKVGQLFPLNIFVLTSLVGGLIGGFASMTGALLKP
ncbi:MAG: hypothetical protein M9954_13115 [Cyclobacteriaceae bacterium]|nr:hypothetical protein [Cyclobacteriaceae bacterium]MCB0500975.1 hypothetical protein [Cyclobacteriaceae bacterium]MCB9236673.1 hypothetical protein [Flammeovirgaceae bacterium]MCO5272594.1 hypothetical protein [Cyclobacteriaceae bacterium]MCW5901951.1 hypothetical protein [Cyclobacteriaceae bacterium]